MPDLRIVASGPDLRTAIEKVRDLISAQRARGLMTEAEAAGAHWAADAIEALQAIEARREKGCRFSDDIHELTIGSVRGG